MKILNNTLTAKERKEPEDNIKEYKSRDGSGKTTKTGSSNSIKRRRKKQEKKEGKINE